MSNSKFSKVDLNNIDTIDYILKQLNGVMNVGMYAVGCGNYRHPVYRNDKYYYPAFALKPMFLAEDEIPMPKTVEFRELKLATAGAALALSHQIHGILLNRWEKHIKQAMDKVQQIKENNVENPVHQSDEPSNSVN